MCLFELFSQVSDVAHGPLGFLGGGGFEISVNFVPRIALVYIILSIHAILVLCDTCNWHTLLFILSGYAWLIKTFYVNNLFMKKRVVRSTLILSCSTIHVWHALFNEHYISRMSDKFLNCLFSKPKAKFALICFPWAGGGSNFYAQWGKMFPEFIEGRFSTSLPNQTS